MWCADHIGCEGCHVVCSLLQPKEALMYADVRSVNTKSNGNKSAQPPANKKYDDGVAYSDIKH